MTSTFSPQACYLAETSWRVVIARAYDAMIAATALANGLPVYTCNPSDFTGIDGLELGAIPHLDSSSPT